MVARAKRRLERSRVHREVQEDLERRRCIGIELAMSAGERSDGIAMHGLASHGGRGTPACASPVDAEELDRKSPCSPNYVAQPREGSGQGAEAEELDGTSPCSQKRGPGAPCLWNGHWPSPRSSYVHTHPSGAKFHMSENFVLSGSEDSGSDAGSSSDTVQDNANGGTFENGYKDHNDVEGMVSDDAMSLQSDAPEARTALHCSMHSLFGSDSEEDQDMENMFEPFESLASSSAMAPAAGVDTFVPKRKSRGVTEAQVLHSSTVLSAQQLNSQKQNTKRAAARDAKKSGKGVKKAAATPPPQPGRLLETVADFWERKKAKAKAKAAASGDG